MTRPDPPKRRVQRPGKLANAAPQGVGRERSNDTEQALVQLKRSFGSAWTENPENPSVKLIACESTLGARINSYANGRWVIRRVAEDTLVALVELKDGSQERLNFQRGVLDQAWKRVHATS